jgi:8-oxo-dGTP pyrophosphatase MutT (NUDIX family)
LSLCDSLPFVPRHLRLPPLSCVDEDMKVPAVIRKMAAAVRPRNGRLQVAALPYRRREDGSIEVLLVTTRGTGRWMVPKGWPMLGKSYSEAAAQEAYEEAGVRGRANPAELGRFDHEKTRFPAPSIDCIVAVFPMPVERELTRWPERDQRTRRWFSIDEAALAVQSPDLAAMIAKIGQCKG